MGQNRQDRPKTDVAPHKNFENERTPAVRSCLDAWYLRFALDARKRFDAWVPIAITLAELPQPVPAPRPSAGARLRVVPTLGHLPDGMITAGLVDRAIDQWETEFGRSTIKNTVSALVLVLDEAVRDGHHRSQPGQGPGPSPHGRPLFSQLGSERDLALPTSPSLSSWWLARRSASLRAVGNVG